MLQSCGIHIRYVLSLQTAIPPVVDQISYIFLPELNGKVSYIYDVTLDDVELAEEMCCAQNVVDSSFEVFEELAEMIMADINLHAPSDPNEALELYLNLLDHIKDII